MRFSVAVMLSEVPGCLKPTKKSETVNVERSRVGEEVSVTRTIRHLYSH